MAESITIRDVPDDTTAELAARAALTGRSSGAAGAWAEGVLSAGHLVAPHLMPAEVGNVLRRAALGGDVAAVDASLAHEDLTSLRVELFPYDACAARIWQLRENVTV